MKPTTTGFLALTLAAAAGAFVSNIDRIDLAPEPETFPPTNFDHNAWRKQPEIALQDAFLDDVIKFSKTVKESIPPRNLALEQHEAIADACVRLAPVQHYHAADAFYASTQEIARTCLKTAEKAAVKHNITYDLKFAEQASNYTKTSYPDPKTAPPVFGQPK